MCGKDSSASSRESERTLTLTWKRPSRTCRRSMGRHRTTPSAVRSGPVSTRLANACLYLSVIRRRRPAPFTSLNGSGSPSFKRRLSETESAGKELGDKVCYHLALKHDIQNHNT